ncbi:MAG: hypothetical protein LC117_00050, partial [Bacteroidia bacterium]|nr:hypothetical protein [Bacteroidia bacterium]
MKTIALFALMLTGISAIGQGYNHQWLLGYDFFPTALKGRAFIDTNALMIQSELRKMTFWGTEGNICDANGNFLMSSNGVWIANANNDTMMNGSGLNPGAFASSWPNGMPISAINLIITYPADSNKYVLFHQTTTDIDDVPSNELFYSIINITMDNGLGAVINKNNIAYSDSLSYGISACRHANGRDWWIVTMRDTSDIALISLFNHTGLVSTIAQHLGFFPYPGGNVAQLTFTPDGKKIITSTYDNPVSRNSSIVISDFNRCTGMFSNTQTVQLTSGAYLWGLAFSPSGKYAYACSSGRIFQVDVNMLAVDTVAVYDGFISPPGSPCCPTTFWNMYLAANGKIYVTSGSGVQHITVINYPDSAGLACDVQQHSIDLVNYLHLRAVPNHPNYYLGCDTTQTICPCLITGVNNLSPPDFKY